MQNSFLNSPHVALESISKSEVVIVELDRIANENCDDDAGLASLPLRFVREMWNFTACMHLSSPRLWLHLELTNDNITWRLPRLY